MDSTDGAILQLLTKNALLPASEISKKLKEKKIMMTERGIRKRIKSMYSRGIITGSTVIINDNFSGKIIKRFMLVKFKNIPNLKQRIKDYNEYVLKSPYCICAIKLRSDFDWMHFRCFPTLEMADEEEAVFRANFGDLIEEFHSYDATVIKNEFNSFLEPKAIEKFLKEYFIK